MTTPLLGNGLLGGKTWPVSSRFFAPLPPLSEQRLVQASFEVHIFWSQGISFLSHLAWCNTGFHSTGTGHKFVRRGPTSSGVGGLSQTPPGFKI